MKLKNLKQIQLRYKKQDGRVVEVQIGIALSCYIQGTKAEQKWGRFYDNEGINARNN